MFNRSLGVNPNNAMGAKDEIRLDTLNLVSSTKRLLLGVQRDGAVQMAVAVLLVSLDRGTRLATKWMCPHNCDRPNMFDCHTDVF